LLRSGSIVSSELLIGALCWFCADAIVTVAVRIESVLVWEHVVVIVDEGDVAAGWAFVVVKVGAVVFT
jgi:hypothetical protein